MHSDRPFLEAIREQPDDDLHRLAWADWLEERGDDDRSAFLRAQLVAARLDETDLALDALEDRADDLLAAHEDEWAGRVGDLASDLGWSRGCIESATLSADVLLDYGDELFETMPSATSGSSRGRRICLASPSVPGWRASNTWRSPTPPTFATHPCRHSWLRRTWVGSRVSTCVGTASRGR